MPDSHYGMHPVVCHAITIISTNVNKNKLILMYRHQFVVQRCSTTCFDLQEVIARRSYKNSVLVVF
jgi:hypothetical protein